MSRSMSRDTIWQGECRGASPSFVHVLRRPSLPACCQPGFKKRLVAYEARPPSWFGGVLNRVGVNQDGSKLVFFKGIVNPGSAKQI
eukprot:12892817-Prorocentrum_lima.AAC.1